MFSEQTTGTNSVVSPIAYAIHQIDAIVRM